jgi:L-iditol 2-dehydrogenase
VRAAVYHGGGRVTLEERPAPVAGPGELLVRVRACGICGSDLMGWYQDPRAPMVPGHEPAGEVAAAGEGAPLAVGTRVAVHHHVPCMACPLCRRGRHTLCPRFRETHLEPGGMAEYVRVPAANAALDVLPLPDDLPLWAATLVEPLGCVVRLWPWSARAVWACWRSRRPARWGPRRSWRANRARSGGHGPRGPARASTPTSPGRGTTLRSRAGRTRCS